jgi:hypothetical protein
VAAAYLDSIRFDKNRPEYTQLKQNRINLRQFVFRIKNLTITNMGLIGTPSPRRKIKPVKTRVNVSSKIASDVKKLQLKELLQSLFRTPLKKKISKKTINRKKTNKKKKIRKTTAPPKPLQPFGEPDHIRITDKEYFSKLHSVKTHLSELFGTTLMLKYDYRTEKLFVHGTESDDFID